MTTIAIERGEGAIASFEPNDILGEPNGVYTEYKQCPNYTLHPDTPEKNAVIEMVIGAGNVIFVTQATTLCTGTDAKGKACNSTGDPYHTCQGLLADPRVVGKDVVWLACRALGLEPAGGSAIGVNAPQYEMGAGAGTEFAEFGTAAWQYFNNASSDEFWDYFQTLNAEQKLSLLTINEIRDQLETENRDVAATTDDFALLQWVTDNYSLLGRAGDLDGGIGVTECAEVCDQCGEPCRLYAAHADSDSYSHRCPSDHEWKTP